MRIYLAGHGAWAPTLGDFFVPPNVTLHFYCAHGSVFNSSWERPLLAGALVDHRDFTLETFLGGSRCRNYVLGHPGGVRSTVKYVNMKAIVPEKALDIQDNAFYAVKSRADDGYWSVSLNSILNKLRNVGAITVEWYACREEFPDWHGEDFEAWKDTARGMIGAVYA